MTETKEATSARTAAARERDAELVAQLREGDQQAFLELYRDWHPSLVRVALNYVRSVGVAEEVAQETWIHFMQQLGRFNGHSSLKTWTFRILVNRAINRGKREHRAATLIRDARDTLARSGRPRGQRQGGDRRVASLSAWTTGGAEARTPEQRLLTAEMRTHLEEAIRSLPDKQQLVLTLRDIQGWRSSEVCELLEISPENQRVILHRARVQVRKSMARYLTRH